MKKILNSIDKKLHDQFSEYGLRAKEWMRKCVMLLPEIEKREIWKKKGFGSIYEYAAKIAGMSRNSVNEALRIFEKISDKPELQRVVEVRGINAIKPVVTLATKETAAFWAQKAEEMSKHTLETYVREVRNGKLSTEEKGVDISINTHQVTGLPGKASITMEIDPEVAEKLQKLKGQGSWNDLMKEFLEHGTCAFPGCTKAYEILHHTKRFALMNEHNPDTLQPLCKEHENIAHLGLIENEHKNPKSWMLLQNPDLHDPAYDIDLAVQRLRQKPRLSNEETLG